MTLHALYYRLENANAIALVRSKKMDAPMYAYMRLSKANLKMLERAIDAKQTIDLSDFGDILYAGMDEPEDYVRELMREEYNFQEDVK